MTAMPDGEPLPPSVPKEPYRGIEEFRYVDAPIFFGRDAEARRLMRLITVYRGVLLYGSSGVGKSSLVNAKIMPLAVEDGYAPERIRVQPVPDAEFVVERIAPTDDREPEFLRSLFANDENSRRVSVSAEDFWTRISGSCGPGIEGPYPLLIFDQFEELVTLSEQISRRDRTAADDVSKAYENTVTTLVRLLRDETLRVKLVFVFREDYYAKLTSFFSYVPTVVDNYLRLEPLHSTELREIIRGPFQRIKFDHELPEAVMEQLEVEFRDRGGSDLINLSEVQIACFRLWHDPAPAKLLQKQHVDGLLETSFSEAIDALPVELHPAAWALLNQMVTDSGTRNVVSADTLLAVLESEHKIIRTNALEALESLERTAHVVRRERRNEVLVYEIVSEFLVPWIMRRKFAAQMQRDYEQRTARLIRKVKLAGIAGLGVIAILILGLVIVRMRTSRESLKIQLDKQRMANRQLEETIAETQNQISKLKVTSAARISSAQSRADEADRRSRDTQAIFVTLTKQRDDAVQLAKRVNHDLEVLKSVPETGDFLERVRQAVAAETADLKEKLAARDAQLKQIMTDRDKTTARYVEILRTNRSITEESVAAGKELNRLRQVAQNCAPSPTPPP